MDLISLENNGSLCIDCGHDMACLVVCLEQSQFKKGWSVRLGGRVKNRFTEKSLLGNRLERDGVSGFK